MLRLLQNVVKVDPAHSRQGRKGSKVDTAALKPVQGSGGLAKHAGHEASRWHALHAQGPGSRGVGRSKGGGLGALGPLVVV